MQTYTYKYAQGLHLTLDARLPRNCSSESVTVIHYHGGYLVVGNKTTFPPVWLQKACSKRSWGYVNPSYRLLPEAKGVDLLQDAYDAAFWTLKNQPGRLIIAGSSAGGGLAFYVANRLTAEGIPPAAVLSLYGMLDFTSNRYILPGSPLTGYPPVRELDHVLAEIQSAKSNKALDGYHFPQNPQDARMVWVNAIHQAALYPDLVADCPGLAARISQEGIKAIPPDRSNRFPLAFQLAAGFPPTALLHGTNDEAVDVSQSSEAAERLKKHHVRVLLKLVDGAGHGFDVTNIPGDIDIEETDSINPSIKSLKDTLYFLDQTVCPRAS